MADSVRAPLDRLFDIATRNGSYPVQPLHISAHFHLLLAALAETAFAGTCAEPAVTPAMRLQAAVLAEAIHRLVMDHARTVSDRVHLEDLAKKECMSLSHYTRVFRAVYGMSPRDYLSMLRQREAKKLLLMPSLPISDVAQRIGYANDSDFSRQFKRWTGMSPKVFRLEACMGFTDRSGKTGSNP
jgi:AraC-like DNA-binding protein